jgi:hypothetical protein
METCTQPGEGRNVDNTLTESSGYGHECGLLPDAEKEADESSRRGGVR